MHTRIRAALAHKSAVALGAGAVLAFSGWWYGTADDRRVDAACGTWSDHRGQLHSVLTESAEAAERAQEHGSDVREQFNDLESVQVVMSNWAGVSDRVVGSLEGTTRNSGEGREGAMTFFLGQVDQQLGNVTESIESGDGRRVASELPELGARLQIVDGICLSAAHG